MRKRQGTSSSFTVTRIEALPPGRYKDPAQRSLYLLVRKRIGAAPSRTWLHRVKAGKRKRKGKDTQRDTFLVIGHFPETSLEAARSACRDQRELLSQGIDPRSARPRRRQRGRLPPLSAPGSDHSIEHLVSEFTELYLRPKRERPEYAEAILKKNVLPEWEGRDARTIKPREVIELLDKIVARGRPVMANRTAALLTQLFKFGIHGAIVETSPVQLLYKPGGKERPRERVLSDDELAAFLKDPKAATRFDRLAHVITLLLLTGQRRGELALARWSDVDFNANTWTIPDENAKGGRGHVVPLSDWAVEELRALKALSEGSRWVLPATPGSDDHLDPHALTRSMAKCLDRFKAQGIAALTLHDLRRTCRTGLARLKVEPHIAERVLNHVQPGIEGVYDRHAYLDEKREALEKWAAHLQRLRGAN